MNKIRFYIYFSVFILFLAGCSKHKEFVVEGKITHAENKMIYLDELHVSGSSPADSSRIDKNGGYKLKGHTGVPAFYLLRLSDNKLITLLIDSAEVVTINADEINFGTKYLVEGSPGSALVKELNMKLSSTQLKLDSVAQLNMIYRGRNDYQLQKAILDEIYQEIMQEQVEFSTRFVEENPFSMASILAIYQKFDDQSYVISDLQPLKTAASALNSIYPQSEHVKALYANTVELVKQERAAKMKQFIQEKGTNSPDVVLPDINGNDIALSSLKGKMVLLQFWSAEDRGSRVMNEMLVELYRNYRNKGFEIYQVSVDKDKDAWVEAIEEDGLTWTNVGDMEGSLKAVHTYNIQEIPYNYLLDREGVIITKGLKGPDLTATIADYLN